MTNREWLQSLSDKELAKVIQPRITAPIICIHCENAKKTCKTCEREKRFEKWLKATRKENDND